MSALETMDIDEGDEHNPKCFKGKQVEEEDKYDGFDEEEET